MASTAGNGGASELRTSAPREGTTSSRSSSSTVSLPQKAMAFVGDALTHATSGLGASIVSTTVVYPLDVVRTRMQAKPKAGDEPFTGTLDAMQRIVMAEGVGGLYAGLSASYIRDSLRNFISMYWYELFKALYHSSKPAAAAAAQPSSTPSTGEAADRAGKDAQEIPVVLNLVLASGSAALTQLLVNPINVAITRMQTKHSQLGLLATLFDIWHTEGLAGLYKGIVPALILTSNMAITFVAFDRLKRLCLLRHAKQQQQQKQRGATSSDKKAGDADDSPQLSAAEAFAISGISKVIATLATYPYMRAKTIMQTTKDSRSTTSVLLNIVRTEGFLGWYTGLGAQLWKSVLTASIMFMAKEKFINMLRQALSAIRGGAKKPTTPVVPAAAATAVTPNGAASS